jgi:hypothetical protein
MLIGEAVRSDERKISRSCRGFALTLLYGKSNTVYGNHTRNHGER